MKHPIAIVTGAGSGIGAATALKLAEDGFALILVGRDAKKLENIRRQVNTPCVAVAVDLTSQDAMNRVLEARASSVLSDLPLQAVVNNAAIFHRLSFGETSERVWREEFEINVFAPVRMIQKIAPILEDGGVILNVSSTLGLRPIAMTSAYSAAKAALNNLTQSLALELAPRLRVLAVCPGLTDTPIHSFFGGDDLAPDRAAAHSMVPMKRMGTSNDIAAMISFLLSPSSNWNTGSLNSVDGGIGLL